MNATANYSVLSRETVKQVTDLILRRAISEIDNDSFVADRCEEDLARAGSYIDQMADGFREPGEAIGLVIGCMSPNRSASPSRITTNNAIVACVAVMRETC